MRRRGICSKIFEVALVCLLFNVMFPLTDYASQSQALAGEAKTLYSDDSGSGCSNAGFATIWRISGAPSDVDVNKLSVLGPDNETSVNSWTRDGNGIVGLSTIERGKTSDQSILSVSGEAIVVRLELLDIPSTLPFNQDFVPDNDPEYWWSINIDVDNNPDTGAYGYDVMIALAHWKQPDSTPNYASIIEGTEHNTWVYTGDHFTYGHEIDVTVDYASNTITMVASKAWEELTNLSENSRFEFDTVCYGPEGVDGDDTADARGSEVIYDPMGDVLYDFIDVIQGSLAIEASPPGIPKFLTLPFSDSNIKIQQGWRYTAPIGPNPDSPYAHNGIDYIKGIVNQPATWQPFDVVAAADGVAMYSSGGGYGDFVLIRHNQTDTEGRNYFTLYGHLGDIEDNIPYRADRFATDYQNWTPVTQGQKIGVAGSTGVSDPTWVHLHFEVQRGNYAQNKVDPYDIYNIRDYYPGGPAYAGCGANSLWMESVCPPPSEVGRIILIEPLQITPAGPYFVGDTITATFTVENTGDAAITLNKLLVGGRYDGWGLPSSGFPDFNYQTVTLQPGDTHRYEGTFTVLEPGNYRFFVAYHIANPTPDEKRLLDENNWNTCVELGESLTDTDRVKSIIVFQEYETPEEVAQLREAINQWRTYHSQHRYPPYLLDADSFTSAVATLWASFTSFITRTDLTEKYDELYLTGIEYEWLSFKALMDADWFLESGSVEGARRCLQRSYMYDRLSAMSFGAAAEVFDTNLEAGGILAKGIMDGCEAAVSVGVAIVYPPAAAKVDVVYAGIDFIITSKVEGVDQATKDLIIKAITKWLLKDVKFTSLGDSTLEAYVNTVSTKFRLDVLLKNEEFMTEFGDALRKVIIDRVGNEVGVWITEKVTEEIVKGVIDYLRSLADSVQVGAKSPVELSVLDSRGQVTGLLDKTVKHEIPMSLYYNGTIEVFFPADFYQYKVVGTSAGTYGVEIASIQGAEAVIFTATDIPTTLGAVHQYTIDWDALSKGEQGVTVQIDSDGDGTFEQSIESDAELTSDEFAVVEEEVGLPFWICVAIGVGVIAILGTVIGRRLVRRRA